MECMKFKAFTIAALMGAATTCQAGLLGETVRASYFVPSGSIFTPGEFAVQNLIVTNGVETTNFGTNRNTRIDIGDDYLEIVSLFMGRSIYDVGQLKFKIVSESITFQSATAVDLGLNLYSTTGLPLRFDQNRVSFTSNELSLNMEGLSVPGNAPIKLYIQTSAIPEASTGAMLLLALPICAWIIRRNRAA